MTESAQTGGSAPTGGVIQLNVDPRASKFTIQAFASGMLSALGHSPTFAARDYQGEVHCNPETGAEAALKLTVKATGLQLMDDLSTKDRKTIEETMQNEVLESAKYPEIVYDSPPSSTTVKKTGDGQFDVALNGNLTLHGVTRQLPVTAKVVANQAMIRAYGEFQIRQSDYKIKLVSVAGGTLKVKDELKCTFDMVARP